MPLSAAVALNRRAIVGGADVTETVLTPDGLDYSFIEACGPAVRTG